MNKVVIFIVIVLICIHGMEIATGVPTVTALMAVGHKQVHIFLHHVDTDLQELGLGVLQAHTPQARIY